MQLLPVGGGRELHGAEAISTVCGFMCEALTQKGVLLLFLSKLYLKYVMRWLKS